MTPTPKCNKKGQFAKTEENPDCAPATKGYVKCLLRKTRQHTHEIHDVGFPSFVAMLFGWAATIVLALIYDKYPATCGYWLAPTFLFSIAMSVIFYEMLQFFGDREVSGEELEILKKHTPPPPVCENKEECG